MSILSEVTSHVSIQTPASVCSLMVVHDAARCWVCIPRFQPMPAGRLQVLSPTAGLVGASHLSAASPAAEKVVQASAGDEPGSASMTADAASPMEHSASPMEDSPPYVRFHGRVSKEEPPRTCSKALSGEPIRLKQQALSRRGLHLPDKHDAEVPPARSGTAQVCHVA